jgi:hypothetical protein
MSRSICRWAGALGQFEARKSRFAQIPILLSKNLSSKNHYIASFVFCFLYTAAVQGNWVEILLCTLRVREKLVREKSKSKGIGKKKNAALGV